MANTTSKSARGKLAKPDLDQVYMQLKICFGKITGFPINQIFNTDSLADKYHFTPGGQRALGHNLESCFAQSGMSIPKQLSRDKLQKAKTVADVADVVDDAFGL